jgi:CBS domain-containing protein
MLARDVMTSPVVIVGPDSPVAHARNLMVRHRISRLLVMEEGTLRGIITKKDIAYRLQQGEAVWRRRPLDRVPVGALMTSDPFTVAPDTGVKTIIRAFVEKGISSVPVAEGGTVAGILTKTDLMKSVLIRQLDCPVRDVMEDVATVDLHHSLDHVIAVMQERHDKVVVMGDQRIPAGIITETNLAFYADEAKISGAAGKEVVVIRHRNADGPGREGLLEVPSVMAADVMTSPVITTAPLTPLQDAIALMEKHHVNSLVVVEDDTIKGIIKRDDIIKEVAK